MKYRHDFVTNSSSSSFICDLCGEIEGGYDLSLSDAGMCECINGHTLCQSHIDSKYDELLKGIDYDSLPEECCPICTFDEYSLFDLSVYLFAKYGVPKLEVLNEVQKANSNRKTVYDAEYITYICNKFNLYPYQIVSTWKNEFDSYRSFRDFLKKYQKNY